jgi:hypothetical protein
MAAMDVTTHRNEGTPSQSKGNGVHADTSPLQIVSCDETDCCVEGRTKIGRTSLKVSNA